MVGLRKQLQHKKQSFPFYRKVLFSLLLALVTSLTFGQDKFNLSDCIEYALDHSLEIQQTNYNLKKQEIAFQQSRTNLLPSFSAGSDYEIYTGRAVNPENNDIIEGNFFSNSYYISGSISLFEGGAKYNQILFEKHQQKAAKATLEKKKDDLAFNILNAYIRLLLDLGFVDIQEKQLELSKIEHTKTLRMIELGLMPGTERYSTEARLANDEFLLIQYKKAATLSENTLKQLMNFPARENFKVETIGDFQTNDYEDVSKDTFFNSSMLLLPEIERLEQHKLASKKLVRIQQSQLCPKLSLYSGWNTGYHETSYDENGNTRAFRTQFNSNDRFYYGLSLNIPLFNGFRRHNNIRKTKISYLQSETQYKLGLQSLRYEIEDAYSAYISAISEYDAAQKAQENQIVAFEAATKKREKGLISSLDFFETKNNKAKAEAEVLRTRLQLYLYQYTLRYYHTGKSY